MRGAVIGIVRGGGRATGGGGGLGRERVSGIPHRVKENLAYY